MGDLSQVIPVLHPYMGGARGAGHAADYEIVDPHLAYVMPARAMGRWSWTCSRTERVGPGRWSRTRGRR
jgi:hypothetical protein